ncbi:membrane protein [Persicobacter diffluens]|uniref:Membrane protein n=2 Tax=Persicobacter diffluens TaxID=981 RepID=A0AAN4W2W1_9BACT|nr:membrane protein [Persicobacter diffluens]
MAQEQEEIKKGYNVGALPVVSYDHDLGFQYGFLANIYNYGDGQDYPQYHHSLYMEYSRFTKGSSIYRLYYDSEYLIPKIRLTADLSYIPNEAENFFGYNGYESRYHPEWEDQESSAYKSKMFYRFKNDFFRFKVDFQGKFAQSHWGWIAGWNMQKISSDLVDIDKLNKGKSADELIPSHDDQPGLFQKYQEWGIISDEEASGGWIPLLTAGITYDSRDQLACPMSGMWFESLISQALPFENQPTYTIGSMIFRHYITIVPKNINFSYRLALQSKIGGDIPFYAKNQMITSVLTGASSYALGGGSSLRGVLRNRVVGDGFGLANIEMRFKVVRWQMLNQNFYLGLVPFVDGGMIINPVDFDKSQISDEDLALHFGDQNESLHLSMGVGTMVAMNDNFIISIDYGKALNLQDGNNAVYIGLNYMF